MQPHTGALGRIGGISAVCLAGAYVVITALYVVAGAVPTEPDGGAWLTYLADQTAVWWGITGLSVLTDLLFLPIAAALYVALGGVNRIAMIAGAGLLVLFVVLDLAVTWPNYGALIGMSQEIRVGDDVDQSTLVAAATYAAAILDSPLWAGYAILVPSLGILVIGLVMLEARFGRVAGWLGVATGVLGSIAVLGGLLLEPLGTLAILTSVLTLLWVLLVGIRLLGAEPTASV